MNLWNNLGPDSLVSSRSMLEKGGGSEEGTTGQQRGLPQGGGNKGVLGSSLKAGFRQSNETQSFLDPIWRRK